MSDSFVVSLQTGGASVTCAVDQKQVVAVPVTLPGSCRLATAEDSEDEPRIIFEAPDIFQFHFPSTSSASDRLHASPCGGSSTPPFRQIVVVQGENVGFEPSSQSDASSGLLASLRDVEERCIQQLSAAAHAERLSALRAAQPQQSVDTEAVPAASSCQHSGPISSVDCNSPSLRQLETLGPARARYVSEIRAALSRQCRWPCCFSVEFPSASFSLVLHSEAFGLLLFCRDKLGLSSLLALGPAQRSSREFITLAASALNLHMDVHSDKDKTSRLAVEVPVDGLWMIDLWKWAHLHKYESRADPNRMMSEENPLDLCGAFCLSWEEPSVIRSEHVWCSCKSCEASRYIFWREKQAVGSMCSNKIINKVLSGFYFPESPSSSALNEAYEACMQDSEMNGDELKITSAHVVSALYRHLCVAVCRAIAEALQRISRSAICDKGSETSDPTYVGILFSGGVDSSLIAGLVLRSLAAAMARASGVHTPCPNNPAGGVAGRDTQFACKCSCSSVEGARRSNDDSVKGRIVVELVSVCFSAEAPDRLTALRSFQDLLGLLRRLGKPCDSGGEEAEVSGCGVVGNWALELRLLAIDVSPDESAECRKLLLRAICPKKSHMDFNIAAPLFFASRGSGYLVSPGFSRSAEWKRLCEDAAVWRELIIRPPPLSRFRRLEAAEFSPDASVSATQCVQQQGNAVAAGCRRGAHEGVATYSCRICSRQAKEGCSQAACKLCCEKLRAVVAAADAGEYDLQNQCIYVGGRGKVPLSAIGFKPQPTCPAHRSTHKLRGSDLLTSAKDEQGERINVEINSKKHPSARPAPFESLEMLPCGVPLATRQGMKPFLAMTSAELTRWFVCALVRIYAATYFLQSRVLLMGSGADELFGGYGRHRTANLTRGWGALRKEQILDLKRLWLRNMGRDARVLHVFNRMARFPFLDETLLRFVCGNVPFEHIVRPACDLHAEAEALLQESRMRALGLNGIKDRETDACKFTESSLKDSQPKDERIDDASSLCCGNKWLLRLSAAECGLTFSAVAKKRAMQFGSRSAKASNKGCFPSNRKARGDASIEEESERESC
ncbi:hypothetical protein Esti_004306 [Eimeria stiedai]